jgi:hypothetical protein
MPVQKFDEFSARCSFRFDSSDDKGWREVFTYSIQFDQPTDVEGQPTGTVRGGKVEIVLKGKDDGNLEVPTMMLDSYKRIDKAQILLRNMLGTEMKSIFMKDCYVVEYEEHFDNNNTDAFLTEKFVITSRVIEITDKNNPITFNNHWSTVKLI